jgi:5-formyltetrahydrofolate cyclo-ligase
MESKSEIRKTFQEHRKNLTTQEIKIASQLINQSFIFNLFPGLYSSKAVFALYLPANNEVETDITAKFFKKNNIKFAYPKMVVKDKPLEFIACEENQTFSNSKIHEGVLEPDSGERIIPNVFIIPLVAFDDRLYRIGMGGGFFDRTIQDLRSQRHKITTIGFAYDFQRSKEYLPVEKTDQRLDFVVSQSEVFRPKSMFSISDTNKKFTDFVN